MLKNPDASVGDWSKYPVPKSGSTVTRTPGKLAPVTPSRTYPRTPMESGVSPMFRRTVLADDTYTDVEVGAYPNAFAASSTLPAGTWMEKKPAALETTDGRTFPPTRAAIWA